MARGMWKAEVISRQFSNRLSESSERLLATFSAVVRDAVSRTSRSEAMPKVEKKRAEATASPS